MVNAAWALAGQVVDRGAVFVITILFARSLTQDQFTQFGFFLLTVTTVSSFSTLGFGVSASRLFARWDAKDEQQGRAIAALWLMSAIAGAALAVASAVSNSHWHPRPQTFDYLLHVFAILAISSGIVAHGGMLGIGKFRESAKIAVAAGSLTLVVGFVASRQSSAFWAQAAVPIGYALSSGMAALFMLRTFPALWVHFRSGLMPGAIRAAALVVGPLALVSVLATTGTWLVGRMTLGHEEDGTAQFAAFLLGLQWFGLVQLIPGMIAKAAFPALADSSRASELERRHVLWRSVRWSIVVAAISAALIAAGSKQLIRIYGESGISAAQLVGFGVAAVPGACANAIGNALVAAGRSRAWLFLTIIWFVCLVALAYVLRGYGASGIAVSLGVSGLAMTCGALVVARRGNLA